MSRHILLLCSLIVTAAAMPVRGDTARAPSAAATECSKLYQGKEYDKAFSQCTAAAKAGDVESQYLLGRQYEKADGVSRDLEAALRLYLSAAEKGHAASQRRVAAAYYWGLGGVSKDEAKAFEWFKRAAEGGDTRAQKQMAEGYRRGIPGVLPKDDKLAREWRERAERGKAN